MAVADYDPIFESAGREWNVDPTLLKAIARAESGGNPRAVSKANASGLMQIIPSTAAGLGVTDPTDPMQSIFGGAKYMSEALDAEKTPEDALRYYHGGPSWRKAYGPESQGYAAAVTGKYQELAAAKSAPASHSSPDQGPAPVSPATVPGDPDQAAGAALIASLASGANAATAPGDPDEAAGMALIHSLAAPAGANAGAVSSADQPTAGSGVVGDILAGGRQGVRDLVSTGANLAKWVDDRVPILARLDSSVGIDPAGLAARSDAARAAFEASPAGQSWAGSAGRVGGQILATAPLMGGGGGILGAAGEGVAGAAANVSPRLGQAVRNTASWLGGRLTGSTPGYNAVARVTSLGAQGALQGGTAGALLSGQSDASLASQVGYGALAGGVIGPIAGAAGAGVNALAGRSGGVAPEVANLARLARDQYGIPINAPQMSSNSLVKIANDQSSKLPFSGAGAGEAATQAAWQRAVSRTMGEDAPLVTPDVMDRAATRIGGVFNGVAARTNVAVDNPMLADLARIESEAGRAPLGAEGQGAIRAQIDNVMDAAATGNGTLNGQAYQQLTRAGSPLQRAQQAADPNVRYYAGQVRDALDGAFQRSAAPADQVALTQARGQYRAMKTIEDLVEKSPDGNLSPALLMGQVRGASSRFDGSTSGMAYTGGGALGDLARIGQQFLKTPPNSSTADRALINGMAAAGGLGAMASAAVAHPISIASVPAGLLANRLAGGYLRSGGLANRLIDSSVNPRAMSAAGSAALSRAGAVGYNSLAAGRGP